jgi:hypothetical protein
MKIECLAAGIALAIASATYADAMVTFDDGPEGWSIQNAVTILPDGGNPGSYLEHYQIDTFGINISNTTNPEFIGDYSAKGSSVTIGLDFKADRIWDQFMGDVPRELIVEFRSTSLAQGGYPWTSVWVKLSDIATGMDWTNLSVTIDDTSSIALPAGWGGYGAEDPDTYEPMLPEGVTFADVMADVDEVVFTTFVPGWFYGFTNYDIGVDNVFISAIPSPGALALLGLGGILGRRRRRA